MTARDRLIYSTMDLMCRRGVAGTGVAEILEHGNVSRRSIYLNFPNGKTEMVAEATRVAGDIIDAQIVRCTELPTPHDALAAFVQEWKDVVSASNFTAGCPVTAAALSRSTSDAVADLAGAAFDQWKRTIGTLLHRHGISDAAANALANIVIAATEGALMMCVAQQSLEALDDVESQMAILLDHHLAEARV